MAVVTFELSKVYFHLMPWRRSTLRMLEVWPVETGSSSIEGTDPWDRPSPFLTSKIKLQSSRRYRRVLSPSPLEHYILKTRTKINLGKWTEGSYLTVLQSLGCLLQIYLRNVWLSIARYKYNEFLGANMQSITCCGAVTEMFIRRRMIDAEPNNSPTKPFCTFIFMKLQ